MTPCRACRTPADPPVTHEAVPIVTQYASADLVEAIAYRGHDPRDDPAWATSGAVDRDEYVSWCRHACGMACLRMALGHRDGSAPSLMSLLRAGLPYGTYRTEADGTVRGLFYEPFARYVESELGMPATVHRRLTVDRVDEELAAGGRVVLVSVHKEIRRSDRPAPGRGGHLVLVVGSDPRAGTVTFHNPSGHTSLSRIATLPRSTFEDFFGHRGVTLRLDR